MSRWTAQPKFCAFWIVWTLNFDAHGNLGLSCRSCSLEKFDSYYFYNGCSFDSFSKAKNSISWKFEIYAKIASFLLWHLQRVNLIWNHQLGENNCLLEVCNKHKNCLVLVIVTCLSQLIKNQVFWAFQLIFTTLARVRVEKKMTQKRSKMYFSNFLKYYVLEKCKNSSMAMILTHFLELNWPQVQVIWTIFREVRG